MQPTAYAKAHMRLIGIKSRFNELLCRKDKTFFSRNWIGINFAGRQGTEAIECIQMDQEAFDRAMRPKTQPGYSAADLEIGLYITTGHKTCFALNNSNELLVIKDNGNNAWQTVINMGSFTEGRARDLADILYRLAPKGAPR